MINPFHDINWQPDNCEIRKFGKSLLFGFLALAIIFFIIGICRCPLSSAWQIPASIAGAGGIIFLLALILPIAAKPIYYLWYFLSACIGIVVANTFLILFFYLIFAPFALVARLLSGRDPLHLKKPGRDSYWRDYQPHQDLKRYLKQY